MGINKNIIGRAIAGVKWATAAAAAVVGVLLAATIIQTRTHDPIIGSDFNAVFQLVERAPSNQNLREEVRALDMLARKAYFTSMRQINTGTTIFFIALAVFLLTWNLQTLLSPTPPPRPGEKTSWWKRQTRSAKTAAVVSAVIAAISISGGIISKYLLISIITAKRGAIVERALSAEEYARWWMNFRGPGGIGVAFHANVPTSFDGELMKNIKWKVEVPLEGFSSPVVYQNSIFLTGGNAESRQVYSFGVSDGKLLWQRNVITSGIENLQMPRVDKETGFAAPSAACDGKNVYAIFATGELAAFTIKGKPLWTKFLGIPDNHYGHASSLITHNGMVIVQFDQYDVGKLFAFEGRTGRTVWEAGRAILSWSSPICVNTGERYELIVVDNEAVTSYDPNTGKMLWAVNCMYGEVGPSAAFANGMAFAANEYAVAAGIDINKVDAGENSKTAWTWRGDLPNTSSPASVDSLLFLAASNGTVTCLNNRTGDVYWSHIFDRGFYSSPIIAGDKVLLFDRDGVMQVFAVSTEFNLIASSPLGEPVTTTPAILNGYMIVRGNKYLYRIDGD